MPNWLYSSCAKWQQHGRCAWIASWEYLPKTLHSLTHWPNRKTKFWHQTLLMWLRTTSGQRSVKIHLNVCLFLHDETVPTVACNSTVLRVWKLLTVWFHTTSGQSSARMCLPVCFYRLGTVQTVAYSSTVFRMWKLLARLSIRKSIRCIIDCVSVLFFSSSFLQYLQERMETAKYKSVLLHFENTARD